MPDFFTREIELRAAEADGDLIPCVLASETPVDRGGWLEVLSHTPADVDLSRAPLPLIVQHDHTQLNVGVVEQMLIVGGKLRGLARFGSSTQAQQILADVKAGIVRSLSVGYELLKPLSETGRTVRFSWKPFEVSAVSVPADPQAGFFRSQNFSKGTLMDTTVTEHDTQTRSHPPRSANRGIADERERVLEIAAIGHAHNMTDLANRAIEAGVSLDVFRSETLQRLKDVGALRLAESSSSDLGLTRREVEQHSFVKAILAQDPTYAARHGGVEDEARRAMAQKLGKDPRGLFIPMEALQGRRDLEVGTPSAGGFLRPTDHMAAGFIDLLRAQSLVLKLNPTRLQGLRGDVSIPRKTAGATASWIAESAPAIESKPAFGQLVLRPRTIGGMTDF